MLTFPESLFAIVSLGLVTLILFQLRRNCRTSSQESLYAALDTAGLALLMVDANDKLEHVSPAFMALAGLPVQAEKLSDFPEPWHGWLETHCRQVLASGSSGPEDRLLAPAGDGPARPLCLRGALLPRAERAAGIILWCENLAAHNEAVNAVLERECALRTRSQHFVQTLVDVIPRPVYAKDEARRYVLANAAFCATLGLSRQEIIGHTHAELFPEKTEEESTLLEDSQVMAGSSVFKEEYIASPLNPEEDRFIIVSKQSCPDAEGHRVLVGTHIDISPWRIAERRLHQALQREKSQRKAVQDFVQRLIDVIPQPVYVKDAQSRYLLINRYLAEDIGKPPQHLLGKGPLELGTEPAYAKLVMDEDQRILAGEVILKEEHIPHPYHGQDSFRLVSKAACTDAEGKPVIVGTNVDISKWRQAEIELQETLKREQDLRKRTQAYIQRLIDVIPHPVFVKDAAGHYVLFNTAFASQQNLPAEKIIGRTTAELSSDPERIAQIQAEDQAVLNGRIVFDERHENAMTGGEEWTDRILSKRSCLDADGIPVIVGASLDVTEFRRTQRALRAALEREEKEKAERQRDAVSPSQADQP